jgi:hypothetical protein
MYRLTVIKAAVFLLIILGLIHKARCDQRSMPSVLTGPSSVIGKQETKPLGIEENPQKGKDAEKPGAYELAVKVDNPTINPGDEIRLTVFITGYGKIEEAKFNFAPPRHFLETQKLRKSLAWAGFGLVSSAISDEGVTGTGMPGFVFSDSSTCTVNPNGIRVINAECIVRILDKANRTVARGAPISMKLETSNDVRAGNHILRFFMSYFNGAEWKVATASTEINVQNPYEQHETLYTIILIFLGFLAVLTPESPLGRLILWFGRKVKAIWRP